MKKKKQKKQPTQKQNRQEYESTKRIIQSAFDEVEKSFRAQALYRAGKSTTPGRAYYI